MQSQWKTRARSAILKSIRARRGPRRGGLMHDSGHDARQCNAPSGELFRTYHSGQSVPACLQCGGLHRRGALCRHRRPGGRGYGQPRNEHHHPGRFGAVHRRIGADERIFRRGIQRSCGGNLRPRCFWDCFFRRRCWRWACRWPGRCCAC